MGKTSIRMSGHQGFILLTIDVEDWFQVENFRTHIPFSSWNTCELRIEKNTHELLDFLDSIVMDRGGVIHAKPRATFFVLGWIAERLPKLVQEIHARGHEVASHGYSHKLSSRHSPGELKEDISISKKLLEDIIGIPVRGYRAPSFSINSQVLRAAEECGYRYDSSFNSFSINHRYGRLDLSQKPRNGIAHRVSDCFYELPISNVNVCGGVLPVGGGAYFRLIPFRVFRWMTRYLLHTESACLFYLHPWELDPEQPKVSGLPSFSRFRHYTNLHKTMPRLSMLLESFQHCTFVSCDEYIALLEKSDRVV